MSKKKDKYALSSTTKPDLENDQWFPKNPAKSASKLSLIVALFDEIAIIILVIVILYFFLR